MVSEAYRVQALGQCGSVASAGAGDPPIFLQPKIESGTIMLSPCPTLTETGEIDGAATQARICLK